MWAALVIALGVLVLSVGLVAWYGAEQLVQRRQPDHPATPADYGLAYEEVGFPARDGLHLKGYWIPAPTTRPGLPPSDERHDIEPDEPPDEGDHTALPLPPVAFAPVPSLPFPSQAIILCHGLSGSL